MFLSYFTPHHLRFWKIERLTMAPKAPNALSQLKAKLKSILKGKKSTKTEAKPAATATAATGTATAAAAGSAAAAPTETTPAAPVAGTARTYSPSTPQIGMVWRWES
jgi:peptidoglycan hydrolase CwlO-like protein